MLGSRASFLPANPRGEEPCSPTAPEGDRHTGERIGEPQERLGDRIRRTHDRNHHDYASSDGHGNGVVAALKHLENAGPHYENCSHANRSRRRKQEVDQTEDEAHQCCDKTGPGS